MKKSTLYIIGAIVLIIGGIAWAMSSMNDDDMMSTAIMQPATEIAMTASANGKAIWQFPDKKALDPAIFGSPQNPLNMDLLPLSNRLTNDAGDAYTTIKNPSMFSDKVKETTGSIELSVQDITAKDSPNSKDAATMEANFKGPDGADFRVVLKKIIPVGPEHPFFGGVGTNVLMHGATGIGTPLVAQEFSYITLWGLGDFYKNDELVDTNRIIHLMVSERTRDENFKLGLGVALPDKLEIHLTMPPQKGSPNGPVDSPLPTGVILPNGKEQPFLHVNFYGNIKVTGNTFIQ